MPPKKTKMIVKQSQDEWSQESITQQNDILYKLLDVQRNATETQIKLSYKKLAIKVHPDKNKEDPQARQKFNKLTEAYKILTDSYKRKLYDQTGTFGEKFNEETFQTAYEYYRQIYKKIEKEDIDAFQSKYKFGEMQQEDLINYYQNNEGDMTQLLQCIPLSVNEDIPRFITFFQNKINQKIIQQNDSFDQTKNKVRLIKSQEQEVKKQQNKNKNGNSMDALVKAIQAKKTGFIDRLENKYGDGKVEVEVPKKKKRL